MLRLHLTCFCSDATLAVFGEVAELLFHGFRSAGAQVEWAPRSMRRGALNLVIDYSERNREWLRRELQVDPEIMLLGHAPELERIPRASEQDIDVLFYGKITPQRAEIVSALRRNGLRVVALGGALQDYGKDRDALIARSRVVLNLHQYDIHVFEQVRVNYLLINGKAVVSEVQDDTEVPDLYRRLVEPVCGIDAIVQRCRQLTGNETLRREREQMAREGMRAQPQATLLAGIACLRPALP